ncbi:MAG: hypothetical protein K2Q18_01720 [Bdellovibrionales bacterium]|nr:hypothetical protein [Bdellovibrionales bacterium]
MNDINNLKKELNDKIHNLFKDNEAYMNYLLQTKQNFLYRYLSTSTQDNVTMTNIDSKTLVAISYEGNMGEAFKINDSEIKEGIKSLAKSIPRENKPRIQYSIKTILEEFKSDKGKIIIESKINWNFPEFSDEKGKFKKKQIIFNYDDPNVFRKELALRYEDVCELFN